MSVLNTPIKSDDWGTFDSNNLEHVLPVAVDLTCTMSRRNFGPLFLTASAQPYS